MKRLVFTFAMLLIVIATFAGNATVSYFFNLDGVLKSNYESFKAGTPVKLMQLIQQKDSYGNKELVVSVNINFNQIAIPLADINVIEFKPTDNQSFWQLMAFQNDIYSRLIDRGYQNELRQDLNSESEEYIKKMMDAHLLYEDPYVEDYVSTIFTSVVFQEFNDQRLKSFQSCIVKSTSPDSYILPNGTLVITTGLLSIIDSPEELTAIIASEVAHFVLDHAIINVCKEEARIKRAIFWGNVVAGALQGVDEYLSREYKYYIPCVPYNAGGLISADFIGKLNSRMGINYSYTQQKQADQCTLKFLAMKGIKTSALASALNKINSYYTDHKDFYNLASDGSYSRIDKRIEQAGNVEEFSNRNYTKVMSIVNTFNAISLLENNKYAYAAELANKNINQKIYSDDDYIVLAKSNMGMYSSEEKNLESLGYIEKAKSMTNVPNFNAYKQEILVLLRLNKQAKAATVIKDYIKILDKSNDSSWTSTEISWASKLLQRISVM